MFSLETKMAQVIILDSESIGDVMLALSTIYFSPFYFSYFILVSAHTGGKRSQRLLRTAKKAEHGNHRIHCVCVCVCVCVTAESESKCACHSVLMGTRLKIHKHTHAEVFTTVTDTVFLKPHPNRKESPRIE